MSRLWQRLADGAWEGDISKSFITCPRCGGNKHTLIRMHTFTNKMKRRADQMQALADSWNKREIE
jgi:hypothetical protein